MHHLACANNTVHWTSLDAKLAANAGSFIDERHLFGFCYTVGCIQGLGVDQELFRDEFNTNFSPGWALINVCLTAQNSLGIVLASGIVALGTLGLRQAMINVVDRWFGMMAVHPVFSFILI